MGFLGSAMGFCNWESATVLIRNCLDSAAGIPQVYFTTGISQISPQKGSPKNNNIKQEMGGCLRIQRLHRTKTGEQRENMNTEAFSCSFSVFAVFIDFLLYSFLDVFGLSCSQKGAETWNNKKLRKLRNGTN